MPRGDGTGRMGMGPMTGRAFGYCAGYPHPGYLMGGYGGLGLGCRRGWRMDRGYGYGFFAPFPLQADAGVLEQRAAALEQELAELKNQIAKQKDAEAK